MKEGERERERERERGGIIIREEEGSKRALVKISAREEPSELGQGPCQLYKH